MGGREWAVFMALAVAMLPLPTRAATCTDAVGEWRWSDRTLVTIP